MLSNNYKKHTIKKNDVFCLTYLILINVGFSKKIDYISLKYQISKKSLFSKNTKSINQKIKQSRHFFKKNNNLAYINGIKRAI